MSEFKRDFHHNQNVMTPKGPATFIGYFQDGFDVQVSRHCQRNGQNIVVNECYPVGSISEIKPAHHAKSKAAPVSQVQDTATA